MGMGNMSKKLEHVTLTLFPLKRVPVWIPGCRVTYWSVWTEKWLFAMLFQKSSYFLGKDTSVSLLRYDTLNN